MEYSKEDLMEATRQILGVGENMGTEESKKIWEKNAQFWDNAMGDKSNEFHREVVRPKVTELLSPNPADYILDIACGNGNYSSYLAQRGASIVAFDYSKKMIELAKRRQSQYAKQIEEEMKKENYDDNENLMSAEEFLDFMKKNRRTIPNERRIANKDKFIWAVRELSETYEIDADLIEDDDGYTASLYMNYASYNGYIKKLLGLIFILSDDFSMFKAKDNRDSDLLMCFTYHTHNVYLKDREITDFS